MNALLEAIGITEIPYGESEASLVKAALEDNFFYNRVIATLVEKHALSVVPTLHKLEREALCDRLVPRKAKVKVTWTLVHPNQSPNGTMMIMAAHGDKETMRWSGAAKSVRALTFYGESVPSEIAYMYELQYSIGMPDPDAVQQTKDRIRWENERQQKQSNTPTSYEEVLAAEAISQLPKVV